MLNRPRRICGSLQRTRSARAQTGTRTNQTCLVRGPTFAQAHCTRSLCAAQIMWDRDCGCVPIVSDNNVVVGMLTDRDICMAAYTTNAPLSALRVGDIMAKQVVACGPFDTVAQAEALMQQHQIRRLPVVGIENQLFGILSLNDLARAARLQPRAPERGTNSDAIEVTLAAVCEPRARHAVVAS